jgi:hypothetical protein
MFFFLIKNILNPTKDKIWTYLDIFIWCIFHLRPYIHRQTLNYYICTWSILMMTFWGRCCYTEETYLLCETFIILKYLSGFFIFCMIFLYTFQVFFNIFFQLCRIKPLFTYNLATIYSITHYFSLNVWVKFFS